MNGREEQKALSVGRSKYSQSRRVELWSRQITIIEDLPPEQRQANNNIDADTGKSPDDELRQPLLDGGQGKTSNFKCDLVILLGDVNADVRQNNNKSSIVPINGDTVHYLEQGNVNDSKPQSLNVERETETLMAYD